MVAKIIGLPLRGLQFFWALLIMALVGNMIATSYRGNPSIINYVMFVAVFSMLSLIFLFAATWNEAWSFHPLLPVALDVLNSLFYFCGGVALAAYLKVHSCNDKSYTLTNSITNGSPDTSKRCHEAQATTAFLWFGFATFVISAALSAMQGSGGSTSMRGGSRGIRRGPAQMSQV